MLLLRVQAGSHLYGYASNVSDDDFFEVHTEPFMISTRDLPRPVRQTIVDGVDTLQMTLSHFMEKAAAGSHQALDAMFAGEAEVDRIAALRQAYRGGTDIIPAYARIIRKFAEQGTYRKQRHALRIMLNLQELIKVGRYTPELSAESITFVNKEAQRDSVSFRALVEELAPVMIFD